MIHKSACHKPHLPAANNIIPIMATNYLFCVWCPWIFFWHIQITSNFLLTWKMWSYTSLLFFGSCNCNSVTSFVSSSSEFIFSLVTYDAIHGNPNLISCLQGKRIYLQDTFSRGETSIYFILVSLKDLFLWRHIFKKILLNYEKKKIHLETEADRESWVMLLYVVWLAWG